MISIILVSHDRWEVTCACIKSIQENVKMPYEIILVDNASSKETVEALKKVSGIRLFCSDINIGFPAGCNAGLRMARGDLVWFLNNDTLVPPNSLERMAELLLSDSAIGMVGPVSNNVSGMQAIPVTYQCNEDINEFAAKIANTYRGLTFHTLRLVGFSMLTRKAILDQLGGFDERMGMGTFEDDDLSLRLVANGYRLLVAQDAFIHHIGSASFSVAGGYPSLGDRNQCIVSTTFGLTVPEETMLNQTLYEQILPRATSLLHVECGAGCLGLKWRERGYRAAGLESCYPKANLAQTQYDKFYRYTAGREFALPEGFGIFEVLVMEQQIHHEDTLAVVRSVLPNLMKGAQVFVQVPKIVAENQGVYEAYMDRWDQIIGHYPARGQFSPKHFIAKMNGMGFGVIHTRLFDAMQSAYAQYSFQRHLKTWKRTPGDLPFFQTWDVEFVYMP